MTDQHDRILTIVGMHRSGTSLVTNWLSECGLSVGQDLIPADQHNQDGHFEDREISMFQREILRRNGLTYVVCDDTELRFAESDYESARTIAERRRPSGQWGWKDPRTCLMLPFWREVLPGAKYLVIYRHSAQVVDSLLRRDRSRPLLYPLGAAGEACPQAHVMPTGRKLLSKGLGPLARPLRSSYANRRLVRRFLCTWNRYNRDILVFAEKHPEDCMVLGLDRLTADSSSASVIRQINREWGFSLRPLAVTEVLKTRLLSSNRDPSFVRAGDQLCSEARDTHAQLEALEQRSRRLHRL